MARSLVMEFQGRRNHADFSKLERRKLYGKRRRIAMDRDGNPCKRVAHRRRSVFDSIRNDRSEHFTDDMRWIPNSDLVGLVDGEPVEKLSTLGEPPRLEAATAQQLLDLRLSAVYMLTGQSVDASLQAALDASEIFTFPLISLGLQSRNGLHCGPTKSEHLCWLALRQRQNGWNLLPPHPSLTTPMKVRTMSLTLRCFGAMRNCANCQPSRSRRHSGL